MSQIAEPVSRNGDGPSLQARRYRDAVRETMRKRERGADGRSRRVEPSDGEVDRFILESRLYGLEPLAGQIYASWRDGEMRAVVPLDGLRALAARTGEYEGQADPEWCDAEGSWRDFWGGADHPTAARVRVHRKDARLPTTGTANWSDFAPASMVGEGSMWSEDEGMPAHLLSIRAEVLALRKAFPAQLSGLYTVEELGIPIPGEAGGAAAADVPTSVAGAPPASPEPAHAPEAPPPAQGPAMIDPPQARPSGAPAPARSRQTLAEVLASSGYERLRGELVEALFGVGPERLTDQQSERMAAALREADVAGVTAAELERTCKVAMRDAGEDLERRSRAVLEWIAERHIRAVAALPADEADGPSSITGERPEAPDPGEGR